MATTHTNSLNAIAGQIKALEKKTIASVVAIGGLLKKAEEACTPGTYMSWVKTNLGWSHSTALNYRRAFELSQIRKICEFDISLSAVHLISANIHRLPLCDDILETAKVGRVTYTKAREIIHAADKRESKVTSLPPPTIIPSVPNPVAPVPATLPPPAMAKPDRQAPETLKPIAAEVVPHQALTPAATAVAVKSTTIDLEDRTNLAKAMINLDALLRGPSGGDLEKAITETGPDLVRDIVIALKTALDARGVKAAIQERADRVAAKVMTPRSSIKSATERAEARSKLTTPSDEFPDLPAALDRRRLN